MPFISLAVTERVIRQIEKGNEYQRQLAIKDASPDLRDILDTANASNKISVAICGVVELIVGDTNAIWEAHQENKLQAEDFSDLFSLLSRRKDEPIKFIW